MREERKRRVKRRVLVSADHGTAIIYFLQSDLVATLLEAGVDVTILTDDETTSHIAARFAMEGLHFEGLRLLQAAEYARSYWPRLQWLLGYLRRVGGSVRMNTAAMDSHIWEVWKEHSWRFRIGVWIPAALGVLGLRFSRLARKALVRLQMRYIPKPGIYQDLLDRLKPDLVHRVHTGLATGSLLAARGQDAGNSDGNGDRWMGQSFELRHSRGGRRLGHLLVGSPEGRACAWV